MTDAATAFDYVVIGAGSSGCVVANRLSADPDTRVLLRFVRDLFGGPGLSPDGAVLATATGSRLRLHRMTDGTIIREAAHDCPPSDPTRNDCGGVDLGISPDGRHLVASYYTKLVIFDADTLAVRHTIMASVGQFSFSPDGLLATGGSSQSEVLVLISPEDGRVVGRVANTGATRGMERFAFVPDRRAILSADEGHRIRLRCY